MSRKITIYKWQGNTQWSVDVEDSYGTTHFIGYFNTLGSCPEYDSAEDMIEWIIEDVVNGRIYQEYAEYYINNLEIIIAKARKLRENE